MARLIRFDREETLPEQAHDPNVVAEAMRNGVTVEQMEQQENVGTPIRDMMVGGVQPDRAFTDTVDIMGAYNDAVARQRGAGPVGVTGPVNRDVIAEAEKKRRDYKRGKAHLEARIVDNEDYFRVMHNGSGGGTGEGYDRSRYRRNTPWLFSAIANKVSDFQDNYPEATVLPREESDEDSARQLTSVLPAILEKNGYRSIYRQQSTDKVKHGTGIQMVVWDPELENGMGDVAIRRVDPLNIYWEPGIEDIQSSSNVFLVELRNNDDIIAQYPDIPDLKDHISTPSADVTRYRYNEDIDTSDKSYVVNWYYKRRQGDSMVLHYCRYVNDVVLYASENDTRYAGEGWYRHGMYPFVFDVMYREVGTPYGFGEIDIGRDAQEDIDDLNAEILRNVKAAARRRFLSRENGGINEKEYMDLDRDIVHVAGNIDENTVREITVNPLSSAVLEIYSHKIDELKETTANRDVTQGGTGGTSTASGIAALQESGNKVSRDLIASSYEAFKKVCELIIELIRQFYAVPRTIRITGDDGAYQFQQVSNEQLISRQVPGNFGVAAYQTAEPVFDVTVKAYKNNPYTKQQANQDAINMYGMGFFDPANGVKALACLELLDIENKDKIRQIITANYEAYLQAQQMAAERMMAMGAGMPAGPGAEEPTGASTQQTKQRSGGSTIVDRARQNAQQGTQPR